MKKLHVGELLDDQVEFTLSELCFSINCNEDWIFQLVEEGVIEPKNDSDKNLKFSGTNLKKVHSAMRLEHDLGINIAGVALVLDLVEEIEQLRLKIELYEESYKL